MSFAKLVQWLQSDTLDVSLPAFRPELVLCATIVLLLAIRLVTGGHKVPPAILAFIGSAVALYFAAPWQHLADLEGGRTEIFAGLLVIDNFTIYVRGLLLFFAVLFVIFTALTGVPDKEDGSDIYALVLGGTLGMCLMASTNHWLMVFLAVEMASVPSYVLAGLMKGKRQGSEAALKYAIFGAGAAGIMLYGISLLAGVAGTLHLPTMANNLAEMLYRGLGPGESTVLILGGLMVMVGLAYKLSAFPFHFWCPDVFEGATAEVNAFLSVASKTGALALLVRVAMGVCTVSSPAALSDSMAVANSGGQVALYSVQPPAEGASSAEAAEAAESESDESAASDESVEGSAAPSEDSPAPVAPQTDPPAGDAAPAGEPSRIPGTGPETDRVPVPRAALADALQPVRQFVVVLICIIAALTCTFGNLAAYGQTNIKRLLAYSTIAHAGFMMMPVAAAVAMLGRGETIQYKIAGELVNVPAEAAAIAAVIFYAAVYLFMNLGAFAVVAFLRNTLRTETIDDYAGLIKQSPWMVIVFSVLLVSLLGLPPLGGFWAKVFVFGSVINAAKETDLSILWLLAAVGGLNTVLSLFYYLRIIRVMTFLPEPESRLPMTWNWLSFSGIYLTALALGVVVLGVFFDWLNVWAISAGMSLSS